MGALMNLRLPLHVLARQHGLVITKQALATALRNGGTTPDLFHIERGPQAVLEPSAASVTLDLWELPSANEGGVVRV